MGGRVLNVLTGDPIEPNPLWPLFACPHHHSCRCLLIINLILHFNSNMISHCSATPSVVKGCCHIWEDWLLFIFFMYVPFSLPSLSHFTWYSPLNRLEVLAHIWLLLDPKVPISSLLFAHMFSMTPNIPPLLQLYIPNSASTSVSCQPSLACGIMI